MVCTQLPVRRIVPKRRSALNYFYEYYKHMQISLLFSFCLLNFFPTFFLFFVFLHTFQQLESRECHFNEIFQPQLRLCKASNDEEN